mgnify:FL=1
MKNLGSCRPIIDIIIVIIIIKPHDCCRHVRDFIDAVFSSGEIILLHFSNGRHPQTLTIILSARFGKQLNIFPAKVSTSTVRLLYACSSQSDSFFCLHVVVVMNDVDQLTKDAQHALRRTMEKYVASCRLILVCTSTSKVIPAIRSRCLAIRVAAPTCEQVLDFISPFSMSASNINFCCKMISGTKWCLLQTDVCCKMSDRKSVV